MLETEFAEKCCWMKCTTSSSVFAETPIFCQYLCRSGNCQTLMTIALNNGNEWRRGTFPKSGVPNEAECSVEMLADAGGLLQKVWFLPGPIASSE